MMALQFTSASLAACGAVTITNPFDMLKTRRQLLNELNRAPPAGAAPPVGGPPRLSLAAIWRVEGLSGLQRGLTAAYFYQILMNGTRFMVYEPVRHSLAGLFAGMPALVLSSTSSSPPASLPPQRRAESHGANVLAGAFAGAAGAAIGSPFNLIKSRLQSYSPHFATGHQHQYGGRITTAVASIARGEGLLGLYRGVSASIWRTTVGSAFQLASYDACKAHLAALCGGSGETPSAALAVHTASAMVSGVVACLVMNPFDVVMVRLYNQSSQQALYSGPFNCAYKTVRAEGLLALWKGLVPHYLRVGPHTVIVLVLLEQIRAALRPLFVGGRA